jgi:hypothetical protein
VIRFAEEKRLEDGGRCPVQLYGRWWSADDADYAREIEASMALRAPDLVREWELRPSRTTASVSIGADALTDTVNEPISRFGDRMAELGLSVRGAAQFLNVSPGSIQKWKREGAPADVMAQLA